MLNQLICVVVLFGILLAGGPYSVSKAEEISDEIEFNVHPAKCISLRKGQICYQKIEVVWKTTAIGDYCLWIDNNEEPLKCWTQASRGIHNIALATKKNRLIYLTAQGKQTHLASAEVTVAWVYRSKAAGRPSWRMF